MGNGKNILNYVKSKEFNLSYQVELPNKKENQFLGFILSNENIREIVLSGWYAGRLSLEDKSYIIALLMAHYQLYGIDKKEYCFKINGIQDIVNLDREIIDLANEIINTKVVLLR